MIARNPDPARAIPRPISWFAAQKRPLVAAHLGALIFLVFAVLADGLPPEPFWRLLWPGLLYYPAFVLSFMLPLWMVQAVVYSQMWQRGRPYFVAVDDAAHLDPGRCCRFLLSLHPFVVVLAVLYVKSNERQVRWTRPAWLFLGLFATALLSFCLWATFAATMSPLLLLSAIIFWSMALIFGLSHLVRGG